MPDSATAIFASGIRASAAARAAARKILSTCSWVKLAYSRWAFYTLYECVKFSDISNSHNALLIMLNFLVNHLLEYESIVSAVMICLTYENQKLTRAHTHCDLLKSLNIRVIISNASLPVA